MEYVIKDVGKSPKVLDANTVLGIYGTKMSLAILEQSFVQQVTIMDDSGAIKTTITKKDE